MNTIKKDEQQQVRICMKNQQPAHRTCVTNLKKRDSIHIKTMNSRQT